MCIEHPSFRDEKRSSRQIHIYFFVTRRDNGDFFYFFFDGIFRYVQLAECGGWNAAAARFYIGEVTFDKCGIDLVSRQYACSRSSGRTTADNKDISAYHDKLETGQGQSWG